MFRIMRLGMMIKKMNVPEDVKALFNLFKLCFYLVLGVHIVGCTWFMVCHINEEKIAPDGHSLQWYPPIYWLDYS